MVEYFRLVSEELFNKLNQVKTFIKKHNPTIGILTEEILRNFLKDYLPKGVSVEQGFVLNKNGDLSKQCDILIYDSNMYAPFYRINNIVVVPDDSIVCIIEVKTTVNKQIFHQVIGYFKSLSEVLNTNTHLFIYNSPNTGKLNEYFNNYEHSGDYQFFDHDTFQYLPDTITGINSSFHLRKDYVILDRDMMGYNSYNYEDENSLEISSLELFYLKIYSQVEDYLNRNTVNKESKSERAQYNESRKLKSIFAIELFDM